MEYIYHRSLELPISQERLVIAFGSIDNAQESMRLIKQNMIDDQGIVVMFGSLVTGVVKNPKSLHYLSRPDELQKSDIDLACHRKIYV